MTTADFRWIRLANEETGNAVRLGIGSNGILIRDNVSGKETYLALTELRNLAVNASAEAQRFAGILTA